MYKNRLMSCFFSFQNITNKKLDTKVNKKQIKNLLKSKKKSNYQSKLLNKK